MKKHLLSASIVTMFGMHATAQNTGIGTINPTDQLHTTGTVRLQQYSGNSTRLMQIDSSGRLVVAGPVATYTNAITITDNGCATGNGINNAITITGQPDAISSSRISVSVRITHPNANNLKIYLVAPNGQVLNLAAAAGSTGANFTNTVFTDDAAQSITAGTAPYNGRYKPQANNTAPCFAGTFVSTFAAIGGGAIVPNGNWAIRVFDAVAGDAGIFNSWSISFSGPEAFVAAGQSDYIPRFSNGNIISSRIYQQAASGNIGIGTISPAYDLDVAGDLRSIGNTLVGGSVGIGTSAMPQKLNIGNGRIRFIGDPSSGATQGIEFTNGTGTTLNGFIGRYNDSMIGLYGFTGAGWQFLFNNTNGYVGLQGNSNPRAPLSFANFTGNKIALWGNADGGHYGLGIQGSLLQMYSEGPTSDIALGWGSSAAFTENMRVKGNGNVGIGTNPTGARLQVQSASSALLQLTNSTALAAGVTDDIVLQSGGTYTGMIRTRGIDPSHAALGFYTNATASQSNLTERLTISDFGLVGIGQTTPTEKLEVNGSIKMTDGSQAAGKVMTSDASGKGSWQAPITTNSAFRASVANTSSLGGYLNIASNSNPLDFDNTGSFNNTTHTFTVPATGVYEFSYSVFVVTLPAPTYSGIIEVDLIKTNAPFVTLDAAILNYAGGQSVNDILKGTTVLRLTAGDQIKLSVTGSTNNNGAVYDPGCGNYLTGHRLY